MRAGVLNAGLRSAAGFQEVNSQTPEQVTERHKREVAVSQHSHVRCLGQRGG